VSHQQSSGIAEQGHSADQLRDYFALTIMSNVSTSDDPAGVQLHTINVTVRYAAATKPFVDPKALAAESVAHLKARVLEHFKLQDSPPGEGKTYSLALGEDLLTNPSATLGSLVQHGNHLKLSLVEQFTQG